MNCKKIFIVRSYINETVTSNNFDIIREAAKATGCDVIDRQTIIDCIKKGNRNDIYVISNKMHSIYLAALGRKQILYWIQGVDSEEYLMGTGNKAGYLLRSFLEKFSLKCIKFFLFVSIAMKNHYETKYSIKFNDNFYIFPCFNTPLYEEAFNYPNKYTNNVFIYAGGTVVWQCFDETLEIYKRFEDMNIPGTKLIVMTKNRSIAEKRIKELGIKKFEIGFTSREELPKVMAEAKFGFVIRKDNVVNQVSTPTKISSYLSCGVIPIYGKCINSFDRQAANMEYAIGWDYEKGNYGKVKQFMSMRIDKDAVLAEYKKVFSSYFSNDYHEKNIREILSNNFEV